MFSSPLEKYKDFKLFWDGEIEKKLCRCAKEFRCYGRLKKLLTPKYYADSPDLFFYNKYYLPALKNLKVHKKEIINFKTYDGRRVRKFPVYGALNSKRHLSLVVAFNILLELGLYGNQLDDAFIMLQKEMYKNHRFETFLCNRLNYLKLFI
jgi:hypothetical protein